MSKSMIKISFLHCKRLYVRKNAQIIPIPETNKTVRDDSESNGKNRNDKKNTCISINYKYVNLLCTGCCDKTHCYVLTT